MKYPVISVLCVVLCVIPCGSANAQPTEPVDGDLEQAMAYSFVTVVLSALRNESLDLTDAQKANIQQLHDIYYAEYNAYLNKSLGLDSDRNTLEVFGKEQNGAIQTPEDIAFLNEMDKTFEKQLKAELISDQIEMVERRVLQRRFELAGLRAIVSSTDIEMVKDLGLSKSLSDIRIMLNLL